MLLNRMTSALFIILFSFQVFGAIEEYAFESEQEEDRFKKLTFEMRCPKCLNSNLAGSDAPIAADLRQEIYEQITQGRSNDEIIEFMSARYGDFILYRPRLTLATFFLWFGPAILLLGGLFIVRRMMLASQLTQQSETALSAGEQETLRKILEPNSD